MLIHVIALCLNTPILTFTSEPIDKSFSGMLFSCNTNFFLEILVPSIAIAATIIGQAVDLHYFNPLLFFAAFCRSFGSFSKPRCMDTPTWFSI